MASGTIAPHKRSHSGAFGATPLTPTKAAVPGGCRVMDGFMDRCGGPACSGCSYCSRTPTEGPEPEGFWAAVVQAADAAEERVDATPLMGAGTSRLQPASVPARAPAPLESSAQREGTTYLARYQAAAL